jgi:hypothetical protein
MKSALFILYSVIILLLPTRPERDTLISSPHLSVYLQEPLQFSIYPNPVKEGRIFIISASNSEMHLSIFNILGEKKLELRTKNKSIFLGTLGSGIYILKLEQDHKTGLKRLVIP